MLKQNLIIVTAILALGLVSCSTTRTTSSGDESNQAKQAQSAANGPKRQPTPEIDSRKDPNNLLFKRGSYFDFNKAEIKPEYQPVLAAHAKYLSEHPASNIVIEGNCDERGTRAYNKKLGMKRALAVKNVLVAKGAKESQIAVISNGKDKPEAKGHNEQSWAANRRADIKYSDLNNLSLLNQMRYLDTARN